MLQLAKDFENFQLARHAKERKDRSSTSFSPPFELCLRQHRSVAVPRRLSLFFCRYGIAMTSNMVAVPRQRTYQLGSSTLFFLSHCMYLPPLLTHEKRLICSRSLVTSSMTATIEVLLLQCIQFFFPKLCLILKNRFLARLSSNFQERLLMKYFMPQFIFGVSIFSLRA